jgi:AP-3 complex subunit mu
MEKHWKSIISKSVLDYFHECQSKCVRPEDLQAVIPTPHHNLIVIHRNKLYFVAVITSEVAPLFVLEFLHRTMDIFEDYFGECSENSIKENFVVVYEVF